MRSQACFGCGCLGGTCTEVITLAFEVTFGSESITQGAVADERMLLWETEGFRHLFPTRPNGLA